MFYDATVEDRLKLIPINVALRRAQDPTEIRAMLDGSENDRTELVEQVMQMMDKSGGRR